MWVPRVSVRRLLVIGSILASASAGAFDELQAAERIAGAFMAAADGNAECLVLPRLISCLVIADDHEADMIATGIVDLADQFGVTLTGWKLTLVTQNDYVVTLPF